MTDAPSSTGGSGKSEKDGMIGRLHGEIAHLEDAQPSDAPNPEEILSARDWFTVQVEDWKREYSRAVAEIEQLRRHPSAVPQILTRRMRTGFRHPVLASKYIVLRAIERLSSRNPVLANRILAALRKIWWKLTLKKVEKGKARVESFEQGTDNEVAFFEVEEHPAGQPLVSVVIPCFNYGAYVGDAVRSVKSQTFQDFEIIVVDGGSTDGTTPEVVKSLQDDKVRVFLREERHRVGSNRNYGIQRARGKYICCLDADDEIAPTYLEKIVFLLESYGYDVASASVQMFGASQHTYGVQENVDLQVLLSGNHVPTGAVFKRSFWEKVGGYRDHGDGSAATHIHEDWEFWIRLAAAGARFFNVQREYLFRYRIHGQTSLSSRPGVRSNEEQIAEIRKINGLEITAEAIAASAAGRKKNRRARNPLMNLTRAVSRTGPQKSLVVAIPWMVVGGAERLISSIVDRLAAEGWRIAIVTTLVPDPEAGQTRDWFLKATAEIFDLPSYLSPDRWPDFMEYLVASRQADTILMAGSAFAYEQLPRIKALFPEIRVCDLLFNTIGHTKNNRRYAGFIDMNIVENSEVSDWLLKQGEPADRVATIPSGVDIHDYRPANDLRLQRALLGFGAAELVVGFTGRWSPEKNPLGFIEIASRLAACGSIQFVMTGAGAMADEIHLALSRIPGLAGRFHLLGNVDDIKRVMSILDLLVIPSTLDGRPVAALEALALGVPVVASRVGGLPDLVVSGLNGELCAPGDTDAFVSAIVLLESDREKLSRLKAGARKFAEEHLDADIMFRKYGEVLSVPRDGMRR